MSAGMSMSTTIIHLRIELLSTKTIGVAVPESLSANTKGVAIGTATAGPIGKSEVSTTKANAAGIVGGFFDLCIIDLRTCWFELPAFNKKMIEAFSERHAAAT
jgi:hypothetical protein